MAFKDSIVSKFCLDNNKEFLGIGLTDGRKFCFDLSNLIKKKNKKYVNGQVTMGW